MTRCACSRYTLQHRNVAIAASPHPKGRLKCDKFMPTSNHTHRFQDSHTSSRCRSARIQKSLAALVVMIALAVFVATMIISAKTSINLRTPNAISAWSAVDSQTNCLRHEITLEVPRGALVYTGPSTTYNSTLLVEDATPWAVPIKNRVKGVWQRTARQP